MPPCYNVILEEWIRPINVIVLAIIRPINVILLAIIRPINVIVHIDFTTENMLTYAA